MQWAKKESKAKYNLAVSGMISYSLRDLPAEIEDLELSRGGDYGYSPLLSALASHTGCLTENVVTAAGTSMANHLAMAAILGPGDEVVIEHPTYELLLSTLGYLQADIRRFRRAPEDGFAVDPAEVERVVTPRTRLIVLTNLHNPSSALIEESTMRRVGDIARSVGARVLVDEVYLDAVFDRPQRSAFHLGPEFVTTNSLTKVYGLSGLRCGWILAEPELARRMWRLDDLFDVNPAYPAELLSCVALVHLDRARAKSRALLETNRITLNRFLASRGDLDVRPLEFGTVAFPRLLTGPVDDFCNLLRRKYETSVVPGVFFEMPDRFRIGISGETAALPPALDRLGAALDEFRSRLSRG